MEWNLKAQATASPWDLSEMEQQQYQHEEETFSSSVNGGRSEMVLFRGGGRSDDQEFSVDLKLGNRTAAAKASKRSRGSSNGGGQSSVVTCLVDDCEADLSNCREYHRRHKVCEIHSKTPQVTISGQTQRFCQQCSRFHGLGEFDEGKRSCRKRLDGHNRRRRKPQPEPFSRYGSILSYQGNQMTQFSSPLAYPSSSIPGWPNNGAVKPEPDSRIQNHIPFPLFNQSSPSEIVPHHFPRAFPLSPEADRPRFTALYDKSTTLSSEGAFSLLSSPAPISEMVLGGHQNDMSFSMSGLSSSMPFHHLHHHHRHHHLGSDVGIGNPESHQSSSVPSHWGHA